uniref:Uncharacterized protein n=1 Tax=Knipowitschia caucasica TaxID=637954 RepID=A0AAV2LTD8_KNICA
MINWSLNAIDSIFSTRKRGSGEPVCPDGTSPAGYTLDSWNKFQPLCLSTLSIEDSEDVYIFGILVVGILLFGFGAILFYHKFGGMAVRKIHDLLADKIDGMYKELSRVVVESAAMCFSPAVSSLHSYLTFLDQGHKQGPTIYNNSHYFSLQQGSLTPASLYLSILLPPSPPFLIVFLLTPSLIPPPSDSYIGPAAGGAHPEKKIRGL